MSSACSPTIRFNRAFSFSSALQPHDVFGLHCLDLRSPALVGLHRDLQVPADRVVVSAAGLRQVRKP